MLEDNPDMPPPEAVACRAAHRGQFCFGDVHAAFSRRQQSGNDMQQGGLAAPGVAQDQPVLAYRTCKVGKIQHRLAVVLMTNVFQMNHKTFII